MLDIGWQELFFIAVIALLVVGPKDLPRALGAVARMYRKARGMAGEFQSGISEMVREAELDDIKRNVEKAGRFDMEKELKGAVDPTGTLTDDFDPEEFNRKLKESVEGGPPGRRVETKVTRTPEGEVREAASTKPDQMIPDQTIPGEKQ
jgi:sec-independent protein translocase protein TatB